MIENSNKKTTYFKIITALKAVTNITPSERPLHRAFLSAIACSTPAFIGIAIDQFYQGLMACMGALVILYLPAAAFKKQMFTMASGSILFVMSFTIASVTSFSAISSVLIVGFLSFVNSIICRKIHIGPPGSFFPFMLACVATVIPFDLTTLPERTLLVAIGCAIASCFAFAYCLIFRTNTSPPKVELSPSETKVSTWKLELFESLLIMGTYAIALSLNLDNPYWAPISCAAVLQGRQLLSVLTRKVQRIIGTLLGLLIASLIFSSELAPIHMAILIMGLIFAIEVLMYKNYALGVIFVTPITILFAEITSSSMSADQLIYARFLDILIGSAIGAVGSWLIIHNYIKLYKDQATEKS